MVAFVVWFIGVVAFFGYCIISATGTNEEERKREDEEQIEYIKKWRQEHDKH